MMFFSWGPTGDETMSESIEYRQKGIACEEQAEQRFQERLYRRAGTAESVTARMAFETDLTERIAVRKSLINPADGLAYERIIGASDLMEINYLDLGLKSAKSVCRIQVRSETGTMLGMGTGLLVAPSLLLTNHHVLDSLEHSRRSLADFNFEDDINFIPKAIKTFALDPDRFFYSNAALDFTLVAVRPQSGDGTALTDFGWLKLMGESGKVLLSEFVSVIQHPDGATKQVCLRENQVVDLPGDFIHYLTDTKPGSSGSPVFNDQWDVVALHHAGVRKRDEQGRVLAVDGSLWEPAMGEEKIAWVANEGVRISSIIRHLWEKINDFPSDQRQLVNEVLTGVAAAPTRAPLPMEPVTQALEWYAGSKGYDPNFLTTPVPLPTVLPDMQNDLVPLISGGGYEIKYTHFSIVMRKSRSLALYTAVNINGNNPVDITRSKDKWYYDPRIDRIYQYGPELYGNNDLDYGHLVRRIDPVWGEDASEANEDTFHFTNCSPQHRELNRATWVRLEDYIIKNARSYGLKVTVFTGPVFRDDDMVYRGKYRIPAEFWKVVAMVRDDEKLSATAYLQTQKNLLTDLEFAYGQYKTYQVPVAKIEAITGLNFGDLRDQDPLADIEGAIALVIERPEDLRL
jgi:endonuclease G, mitochondrial